MGYSRLTELDQVMVCGRRGQTSDVEVGFAELVPACSATAAAVVGAAVRAWAGWSHWVWRGGNKWLEQVGKGQAELRLSFTKTPCLQPLHILVLCRAHKAVTWLQLPLLAGVVDCGHKKVFDCSLTVCNVEFDYLVIRLCSLLTRGDLFL